ncbi:MAG TPA: alpha/beta hydrolase [Hyphomicrobium sp.]|nr:alpha/beta hydrolase [Hyphomicrobium sp.]
MDRFPSKITRRRALQALASVALCGRAGTLHGEPAGKTREQTPWLTLPPTPELPQTDRSGIAEVNGTRLFYAQFGEGEPVLLLHGGMGSSNYWAYQIGSLARTHAVTVMDTRGHGRSPVTSSAFGYELFADDVVALMDYLRLPKASLVGWSDGAVTGLLTAMHRPDRVARLFTFGANFSDDGAKAGGGRTSVFVAYSSRCRAEYRTLSPEPDKWPELIAGLRATWHSEVHITKRKLATLKCPTTMCVGQYDEIIKWERAQDMAGAIPGGRFVLLPGVSHFGMLQNPELFNRALEEFLAT